MHSSLIQSMKVHVENLSIKLPEIYSEISWRDYVQQSLQSLQLNLFQTEYLEFSFVHGISHQHIQYLDFSQKMVDRFFSSFWRTTENFIEKFFCTKKITHRSASWMPLVDKGLSKSLVQNRPNLILHVLKKIFFQQLAWIKLFF